MTNFIIQYSPNSPSKPLKSFNEIGGRLPHTYAINKRYGPVPKCYHDLLFSKGTHPLSDTDLEAPPASLYMTILKGAFKDILVAAEQGRNKKSSDMAPLHGTTKMIDAGEDTLVNKSHHITFSPDNTSSPAKRSLKRVRTGEPRET